MSRSYIIICQFLSGYDWEITFGGFGKIANHDKMGLNMKEAFLRQFPKFKVDPETGEMKWRYTVENPRTPPISTVQRIINKLMYNKDGQVSNSSFWRGSPDNGTYTWTITVQ